ncbi:FtsW/RodA/SpoVE family cell cycle protein [Clostridium paraputrificum]|uniref:FtsW/RodA/SpoVE family cell cycle protein n=1 Tax=Clostridium TaxID=1485 RepID=UPI003D33FC25
MFKRDRLISRYKLDFRLIREIDKALLFSTMGLILFGILNIYLCTKGGVFEKVGPLYFAKKQMIHFLISMVVVYFLLVIDYRVIYGYIPIFYWGSVILLITVWIPKIGVEVNGAKGWVNLGITTLQPSEIAKFAIILMLAKLLDEMDCEINNFKNLSKIAGYVLLPVFLILIQKDMGMTMVSFFIVLGMLFIAGLDKRIIIGGFSILFISITILWNTELIFVHQKDRILEFMSSEEDYSGNGYQLNQGLIGIGSGGILGSKPSFNPEVSPGYAGTHVPEVQTDFIFSAIAEQWGFIGALFLLFMYGVLITKMIVIARNARDRFGSLIAVGIVSYFLFAVTQNIGMTIRLLPITGITLPLVSYGGSSLVTTTMAVALVLNIGMRKQKIYF